MNNDLAYVSMETEEPYKWSSRSTASTLTQLEGQRVEFADKPAPRIGYRSRNFFTLRDASPVGMTSENYTAGAWYPMPEVVAFVSGTNYPLENGYYIVQMPVIPPNIGVVAMTNMILPAAASSFIGSLGNDDNLKNEAAIQQVEKCYKLSLSEEVRVFLNDNLGLADLLIEAISPLNSVFSEIDRLDLEIFGDPEDTEHREIACSIFTKLEPKEALQRLNRFDENWFLGHLDQTGGMLNFRLDFA